ncbi:MAG: hypothetical protein R3B93_13005 [Bacteroidia bacterium]
MSRTSFLPKKNKVVNFRIGMNNTCQRLQHVYGDRHQLQAEDVNEQHNVTLQLNLSGMKFIALDDEPLALVLIERMLPICLNGN